MSRTGRVLIVSPTVETKRFLINDGGWQEVIMRKGGPCSRMPTLANHRPSVKLSNVSELYRTTSFKSLTLKLNSEVTPNNPMATRADAYRWRVWMLQRDDVPNRLTGLCYFPSSNKETRGLTVANLEALAVLLTTCLILSWQVRGEELKRNFTNMVGAIARVAVTHDN